MQKAKELLHEQEEKYFRQRPKKWVVCGLGVLIGAALGIGVPSIYQLMTNSLYDRT